MEHELKGRLKYQDRNVILFTDAERCLDNDSSVIVADILSTVKLIVYFNRLLREKSMSL
jgi:hypothetical protein